jgi:tRNA dimethylallyltransferase
MRAIGVAPLLAIAAGTLTIADGVAQAQAETRQYLKRQSTWIKNHMIAWMCISTQSMETSVADSLAFIQS